MANYGEDSVSIIDETRGAVIGTVKVGHRPEGIAIDVDRDRAAVANTQGGDGSGSVTVIDGKRLAVVETLRVGGFPHAVTFDEASGKTHVAGVGAEK